MQEVASLDSKKKKKVQSGSAGLQKKVSLMPVAAFFITLLGYISLTAMCEVFPIGQYSISVSDLTAQYAPFLALFRDKMVGIGDADNLVSYLTYSFQAGLGKNFMATYGYYLASPFNLLFGLIDGAYVEAFVVFLMANKLSFSAAFMCMFLSVRGGSNKGRWPVLLGVIYAFSSYIVAYVFQIMWLDGYMLLPLLLYFVEKFIKEKKYVGIIVTLLVLFLSNYYIAYMVGVFSFFYLLSRLYVEGEFSNIKAAFGKIGKFILIAVMCALTMGIVLVPVGLDTLKNADQTISSASSDYITYSLTDILDRLLLGITGDFGDVEPNNLPWFFLSLMVTSLVVVYFVSKNFSGKEKKVNIAWLVFAYVSTAVSFVDRAWQCFDDPNWFNHRHVFVFYPIFLVIALKVLEEIEKVTKKELLISLLITLGILFAAQSFGTMGDNDRNFIYNLIIIVVVFLIFFGMKKTDWSGQLQNMNKLLPMIMAIIIGFEVIYLSATLSEGVSTFTVYYGDAGEYMQSIYAMQDLSLISGEVNQMNGAFRAESERIDAYSLKHVTTEGEAMYGDFNGVSFFNSNSNKLLHRFMKQFGYPVNYNYFAQTYNHASPDTDAFLSIGAIASLRDYSLAKNIGTDNYELGFNYYVNRNVLPLAFAADNKASDFDFYMLEEAVGEKNYFQFRNEWYKSMFPEAFTEDFFIPVFDGEDDVPEISNAMLDASKDLTTMAEYQSSISSAKVDEVEETKVAEDADPLGNENLASKENAEYYVEYYKANKDIPMVATYNVVASEAGEYYMNFSAPAATHAQAVYVNGICIFETTEGTFYSQVFRLGYFEKDEVIKVSISSDANKWGYLDVNFAYFDYDKFAEQFDKIDVSKVKVDDVSDGYVVLSSDTKENEMILTSIPYEEGWTATVNGKPVDVEAYQDAMIALNVPAGHNEVVLTYVAPGFKIGAAMSCVGILLLASFVVIDKNKTKISKK